MSATSITAPRVADHRAPVDPRRVEILRALARKVLWLSSWTIHNANHLRARRDGLKVGGHQASSASLVTLMTALFLHTLRPQDRVAVKPHASPVFHALQYLLHHQSREKLERFRGLGGAQSYPSRTKDADDVDFSTGSVGLGVAQTLFASMVQDYVHLKGMVGGGDAPGRMVALVGDAEFDEGNISGTSGGSSTTTGRAWTASSRIVCSSASSACSIPSAGASSRSNTASSSRPPLPRRTATGCGRGSTTARTRSIPP
jgi:pyruvate dehydrogenase complex dehydrogenase (E1) component